LLRPGARTLQSGQHAPRRETPHVTPRVHFVSLGCPKNRVDSEQMVARVRAAGMEPVPEPEDADAIVVHTCGFIGDAKAESIDTILEMAQYKERGPCRALVVTGCLVQRHAAELQAEIPEIDALLGTASFLDAAEVIAARLQAPSHSAPHVDVRAPGQELTSQQDCGLPRALGDHGGSAYLKIAEGCDRACAFCIIPALRGAQRSLSLDALVDEATVLVRQGVVELNLIAQDLTAYGRDLDPPRDLVNLLEALDAIEGLRWIRLLYAYPQGVTPRLRRFVASARRVLPYLDVPVQHASTAVLRRMKRGSGGAALRRHLQQLRAQVPGLALRTTLLTGFPGETDADHAELVQFVRDTGFDRLGVFAYSDEEGTAAFRMRDKVPGRVARQRQRALLRVQGRVSRQRLRALRGGVHEAIVEGLHPESELLVVGRLWNQAPEIDGQTILSSAQPLSRGQLVRVRVVDSHDYDLVAEVLDDDDPALPAPFATRPRPARRT
ncbi:MAG: 30S ribosomal protein S12 methylthiotransferase RimO, partial [Pseudomonadota bacterium]